MKNRFWASFAGCIIVVLGISLLGSVLNFWDFHMLTGWWSLILIVPSLYWMSRRGPSVGNVFVLILGVLWLADAYDLLRGISVWSLILPILIILIGVSVLIKSFTRAKRLQDMQASTHEFPSYNILFTTKKDVNYTKDLKGADLSALCGKLVVDFRDAEVNQNILMTVDNVCSSVILYVPSNVSVSIDGDNLFGGVTNHTTSSGVYSITLRCSCICGSIHIYN